ncbi:MAG TPA: STAS domain-containing protein [Abditibacteriaceae bacterium]|jgi:anti-sigma B factor antagonist
MDLRLRTRESDGAAIVEVGGEVELHSAPQLREELHRVCDSDARCIVVDLSRVSFIDSTGLGVLIGGLKRAREKGSLSLVCPQPRVRRIFEITGLLQVFPMFDSVDAAIENCGQVANGGTAQPATTQGAGDG